MKRKVIQYTEGEIGRLRVTGDFLPPPDKLVLREENVKVTLSLSQRRLLQARNEEAPRALMAHDPRTGG